MLKNLELDVAPVEDAPVISWSPLASCAVQAEIYAENEYLGGKGIFSRTSRRHFVDTKNWAALLRSEDGLGIPEHHGGQKRKVKITRIMHAGQRNFDDEGLYGGTVKSINDALKDLGWIRDDNKKWRELELSEVRWSDLQGAWAREYAKYKISTAIAIFAPVYVRGGAV